MHNDNEVVLLDYMGSDEHHATAAWCSTFLDLDIPMPENVSDRIDAIVDAIRTKAPRAKDVEGLLNYLASSTPKHESPFRFSTFVFAIKCDIATQIHFLKHRVLLEAENAESARYKVLKDSTYIPSDWPEYLQLALQDHSDNCNKAYRKAYDALLQHGFSKQRAKETARFFKPYATQLNTMKKISFSGLMQLHYKRGLDSPSQREIANIVESMVDQVRNIKGNPFKYSLEAFGM